jgi:hypothetical protein
LTITIRFLLLSDHDMVSDSFCSLRIETSLCTLVSFCLDVVGIIDGRVIRVAIVHGLTIFLLSVHAISKAFSMFCWMFSAVSRRLGH